MLIRHKCKNHLMTLAAMRLRHRHNSQPEPIIPDKVGRETAISNMINHMRVFHNNSIGNSSSIGGNNSHMALRPVVMPVPMS